MKKNSRVSKKVSSAKTSTNNFNVAETLKKVDYSDASKLTKRIKADAHKFSDVRRNILSFCSTDKVDNRTAINDTNVVLLRKSKKDSVLYTDLVKLSAFTYKAVKTDEAHAIEKSYKVSDVLNSCSIYLQHDCVTAFIASVVIERKNEAIAKCKKDIVSSSKKLDELILIHANLSDVVLKDSMQKKVDSAKKQLEAKTALLNLATTL